MKNQRIFKKFPKLLVIVGPTASGKSELALSLAKKFNGEIVSADSRQIYRVMDIGTAKPKLMTSHHSLVTRGIPHHLIDIRNPDQNYTAAEYKRDAIRAIRGILRRGKLPILVGGTGLYVKAVVENLNIPKVTADPILRRELERELKESGLAHIYRELIKIDPEAAYIIDPKNPRRVIRALEIALSTKKPFSAQRTRGTSLFDTLQIGLSMPAATLRRAINRRCEWMLKNGLVLEVKRLVKKYGSQARAFDAIGYREVIEYINGNLTKDQLVEKLKINTWHYAKRQMTWFKKDQSVRWVKSQEEAGKISRQFLKKRKPRVTQGFLNIRTLPLPYSRNERGESVSLGVAAPPGFSW